MWASDVATLSQFALTSLERIELFFGVPGAMEGGEELSEAPESDSGLMEPCEVEESFR